MPMTDSALYRDAGLAVYEQSHYSHGEHMGEVEAILSWYKREKSRILDLGCSGGLHALELAKRGHRVTGVDLEASAISLARKRCEDLGLKARFFVSDLEKHDLAGLGRFDLIYSLGNVISHIPKKALPGLQARAGSCLERDGILLFDVLNIGESFPEEIREEDLDITWRRRLDRDSGAIILKGIFNRFGVIQEFRVWGHSGEEMVELLRRAGFRGVEISPTLDFAAPFAPGENPACLRYRAWKMEER